MLFSTKGTPGRIAILCFFLTVLLAACDTGTPTVTPTPFPTQRPLSPGNGGGTGRIAFSCLLPSSSTTTLCLSALDGSGMQQFKHLPANVYCPQWSPDGRRIAFCTTGEGSHISGDIWVVNADGSGLTNLTHASQQLNIDPSWSPDGKHIVFSALFANRPALYLMNSDGSQKRPLLISIEAEAPAWSPDGRKIAFVSEDTDPTLSGIYLVNADGSGLERLTRASGQYGPLVWSPDSKKLLYGYATFVPAGSDQTVSQSVVYMMNADGSHQVQLTKNSSAVDSSIPSSWSLDETKILFSRSERSGEHLRDIETTIWVMNADGSGQTQLNLPAQVEGNAVLQP